MHHALAVTVKLLSLVLPLIYYVRLLIVRGKNVCYIDASSLQISHFLCEVYVASAADAISPSVSSTCLYVANSELEEPAKKKKKKKKKNRTE